MENGELENSESWDYERPEVRKPVKTPRVVVSVAFHHEDFAQVADYAQHSGKKISAFVRETALEKVTGHPGSRLAYAGGSLGVQWWGECPPTYTQVQGTAIEYPRLTETA